MANVLVMGDAGFTGAHEIEIDLSFDPVFEALSGECIV
jgi:hypothetical protein